MTEQGGLYSFVRDIIDKNLHRSLKFSVSGFLGFLLVEFFTFFFFHYLGLRNLVAVPPSFLIGVAFEFVANEYWTTKNEGHHGGNLPGLLIRLSKYELMNLGGTFIAVLIQYIIYMAFGITPLIGNIVGSAFAFPINYYVQMKVTWKIRVV